MSQVFRISLGLPDPIMIGLRNITIFDHQKAQGELKTPGARNQQELVWWGARERPTLCGLNCVVGRPSATHPTWLRRVPS